MTSLQKEQPREEKNLEVLRMWLETLLKQEMSGVNVDEIRKAQCHGVLCRGTIIFHEVPVLHCLSLSFSPNHDGLA